MTAQPSNFAPRDVDPLRERLSESYAGLTERTADLVAAAARVPAKLDDETLRVATDFVGRQMKPHRKAVDGSRVAEKEPFLSGQRTVDGFFAEMFLPLTEAIASVERKISVYLRAKEAEERKRREEESVRQRAEAEAAAAAMESEDDLEIAVAAEQAAQNLDRQAQAKPADLARTHGAHGGVATLRTSVGHEVVEKRRACAELWRLIDDEALAKAVRAHIRSRGEGLKAEVAKADVHEHGVRFFNDARALVR